MKRQTVTIKALLSNEEKKRNSMVLKMVPRNRKDSHLVMKAEGR
jgi:hypothetical protein